MKRILVIENVNYIDYPTGGIMNFYRNMMQAFGNELILAGISTDSATPVGKWIKKNIEDKEYDFYSMARVKMKSSKPLVPERIKNCIHVKMHIKNILKHGKFDVIFTRTPEVMLFIPDEYLNITCNYLPGVGNPIRISRYSWARVFADFYDRYILMPKASKVRWLLAAADAAARNKFAMRSNGLIKAENIKQFPTRFNEKFYRVYSANETKRTDSVSTFVTVGRLGWFKGWKLMVDSFAEYNKIYPNSKFEFIGDGEDEQKIIKYITDLNLSDRVFLLGKKNPQEIGEILNNSSVFVMGSMAEGWSTTLVEACACGIPCVVTNFSSAKAMIKNGKNGFVVDNRDAISFKDCMVKALQLNRQSVIDFNKRYQKYAQCYLKEDLLNILCD